jgi:hypothetical protein
MSRPPGVTWDLRVARYSETEHKVWDAVEAAQEGGVTVEEFRRMCAQAWDHALGERSRNDARDWAR